MSKTTDEITNELDDWNHWWSYGLTDERQFRKFWARCIEARKYFRTQLRGEDILMDPILPIAFVVADWARWNKEEWARREHESYSKTLDARCADRYKDRAEKKELRRRIRTLEKREAKLREKIKAAKKPTKTTPNS